MTACGLGPGYCYVGTVEASAVCGACDSCDVD